MTGFYDFNIFILVHEKTGKNQNWTEIFGPISDNSALNHHKYVTVEFLTNAA